jgi:glucose/arabinose dehydrogenase
MKLLHRSALLFGSALVILHASRTDSWNILTGSDAWSDTVKLVPGLARLITPTDLPTPDGGALSPEPYVPRPDGAMPLAPPGFEVNIYAQPSSAPRQIRTAPNGDVFVASQNSGLITVYRGLDAEGRAVQSETFASGLDEPFGIAFYPVGENPQWVYIGSNDSVVRFPYRNGDMKATGSAQDVVRLPSGGHSTRDVVFSNDGKSMFVSVGSASDHNDPATNSSENYRAAVLELAPDGKFLGVYANGIRNPVGLAIHPATGELWTSVNERDDLGDNLVPDYITHVQRNGFYGWPYFYIGGNPDPRLRGAGAALKSLVIVPDVLIQPHSASLGMTFYTGTQFPIEYIHDAFAAEHGSWNRSVMSGHEVVRVPLEGGRSNGVYQDFVTGFIDSDGHPWGRPVGVATAQDGSLLVTDDYAKIIWRISYTGRSGTMGRVRAEE